MNEQKKTEAVLALAEQAWQDYVFPEGVAAEDADGWSYEVPFHGDVEITRAFYLGSGEGDGPTSRCYFTVTVDSEALAVKDAYAIDLSGNMFGEPAAHAAAPQP